MREKKCERDRPILLRDTGDGAPAQDGAAGAGELVRHVEGHRRRRMPGGGGPGKPVETAAIRLDERGVYERLQEIHVRLLVLEGDAAAVRGCLDGLSGKYKSILQLRHKCHHSWANISVRMGAPDSTVRSWHDKAVLCLGEALDEVPMAEELLERASRARTY